MTLKELEIGINLFFLFPYFFKKWNKNVEKIDESSYN